MLVFFGDNPVFMFGKGLIGQEVAKTLLQNRGLGPASVDYNWQDLNQRRAVRSWLKQQLPAQAPVSVLWSEGQTGFGSTEDQVAGEVALFEELAQFVEGLADAGHHTAFHVISSAGGLFEGQRYVGGDSNAAPKRPYGAGKLKQEAMAEALAKQALVDVQIYRPSSVFGFVPERRMGLISTLIRNTYLDKPTTLTGSLDTMRDYVSNADVGAYIATRLAAPAETRTTALLARGEATSIREIIDMVQVATGKDVHLLHEAAGTNAEHMGFLKDALPEDWTTTPIERDITLCAGAVRAHLQNRGFEPV